MEQSFSRVDDNNVIWQIGVYDAHCHPTDIMAYIGDIANMKARVLTIMASRSQDQHLVTETASKYLFRAKSDLSRQNSSFVIPAFGWHPWFSYQIYDDRADAADVDRIKHFQSVLNPYPDDEDFLRSLPDLLPLSKFLAETEAQLHQYPLALIGEVGLDKAFRLPVGQFSSPGDAKFKTEQPDGDYTPGSREGRSLSPYRVSMDHQKMVLKAQLELAAKLRRPVSIHSVQAHGVVFELVQSMWVGHEKLSKRQQKRRRSFSGAHEADDEEPEEGVNAAKQEEALPFPPRICMHSYSGPAEPLRQFLHPSVPVDVFFSFSQVINFSSPAAAKAAEVIKALPDSRLLIESDFHCAGDKMDELLLEAVKKVCKIKGWALEDGAQQLKSNWERFIFG